MGNYPKVNGWAIAFFITAALFLFYVIGTSTAEKQAADNNPIKQEIVSNVTDENLKNEVLENESNQPKEQTNAEQTDSSSTENSTMGNVEQPLPITLDYKTKPKYDSVERCINGEYVFMKLPVLWELDTKTSECSFFIKETTIFSDNPRRMELSLYDKVPEKITKQIANNLLVHTSKIRMDDVLFSIYTDNVTSDSSKISTFYFVGERNGIQIVIICNNKEPGVEMDLDLTNYFKFAQEFNQDIFFNF